MPTLGTLLEELVEVQGGGTRVALLWTWWRSRRLLCFLHCIIYGGAGVGPVHHRGKTAVWHGKAKLSSILTVHYSQRLFNALFLPSLILVCRVPVIATVPLIQMKKISFYGTQYVNNTSYDKYMEIHIAKQRCKQLLTI